MTFTPLVELQHRIQRLQQLMTTRQIGLVVMMQNIDLFYFSGTAQAGWLLVPVEGQPLLVVRRDVTRAESESPMRPLVPAPPIRELPNLLKSYGLAMPETVGLEADVLPAKEYLLYEKLFAPARITDAGNIIRQVRMIKSPYEIELMRQAAKLHDRMFSHTEAVLQEGLPEIELAAELEAFSRRQGHQGHVPCRGFNFEMHYGHLMSGPTAALPSSVDSPTGGPGLAPSFPQSAGLQPIRRNAPVMVDYVGRYNSYLVDQTRIYVLGRLPEKLYRAHRTALEIQEMIVGEARPGSGCADLYAKALGMAERAGLSEYFMGHGSQAPFVGHGIGLELDELPVLARRMDLPLEVGMVFALEPKFILPGEGVVGIENSYIVTESGLEKLSGYPDAIKEL